jgi:uncharacterized protein (DUF58 family)
MLERLIHRGGPRGERDASAGTFFGRLRARLGGRRRGGRGSGDLAGVLDERVLRQIERLSLVPRWPVSGGLGGDHRSRTQAPSIDFSDHRTYAPGDDLRRLDWRAYGRLGSLQVRTTEGRERLDVAIVPTAQRRWRWGNPTSSTTPGRSRARSPR